jgi:hypothetical protein
MMPSFLSFKAMPCKSSSRRLAVFFFACFSVIAASGSMEVLAQGRPHTPGTPIIFVAEPAEVALQFPEVTIQVVLKDKTSFAMQVGALNNVRGESRLFTLNVWGVEPTQKEQGRNGAFDNFQKYKLWGIEDDRGGWHNFDDIERLTIEYKRSTARGEFDGYRVVLGFRWVKDPNDGWRAVYGEALHNWGSGSLALKLTNRTISRKLEFHLESESGPEAVAQSRLGISMGLMTGASRTTEQYTGGSIITLPMGTTVTSCELTAASAAVFGLASKCQWVWQADQGPVKLVLTGKNTEFTVPFDRDGSAAKPQFSSMLAYLTRADRTIVQAAIVQGVGDTIKLAGTSTMTSVGFKLSGDPNFEDLEVAALPLDGSKLQLTRRHPGVVLVVDASQSLISIRERVLTELEKVVAQLLKSPIREKFSVAVSSAQDYGSIPDLGKIREFFGEGFRTSGTSAPRPRVALPSAQTAALEYNKGVDGLKNRIVYIVASDPVLDFPWRDTPPFDPKKVDLFVVELGFDASTPAGDKFFRDFFGTSFDSRYRYVKSPEEMSRIIASFSLN